MSGRTIVVGGGLSGLACARELASGFVLLDRPLAARARPGDARVDLEEVAGRQPARSATPRADLQRGPLDAVPLPVPPRGAAAEDGRRLPARLHRSDGGPRRPRVA